MLDTEFERWRSGALPSSELVAAIHEFHEQDARALWSTHQWLEDPDIVARGLALGLIASDSVSEALRAKLEPLMKGFDRVKTWRP